MSDQENEDNERMNARKAKARKVLDANAEGALAMLKKLKKGILPLQQKALAILQNAKEQNLQKLPAQQIRDSYFRIVNPDTPLTKMEQLLITTSIARKHLAEMAMKEKDAINREDEEWKNPEGESEKLTQLKMAHTTVNKFSDNLVMLYVRGGAIPKTLMQKFIGVAENIAREYEHGSDERLEQAENEERLYEIYRAEATFEIFKTLIHGSPVEDKIYRNNTAPRPDNEDIMRYHGIIPREEFRELLGQAEYMLQMHHENEGMPLIDKLKPRPKTSEYTIELVHRINSVLEPYLLKPQTHEEAKIEETSILQKKLDTIHMKFKQSANALHQRMMTVEHSIDTVKELGASLGYDLDSGKEHGA